VVGEENLKTELRSQGLNVLPEFFDQNEKEVIDPSLVDSVVVAFDRTLDYRKLNTAYQALINGAKLFVTNPDKTCPMPGGEIPDAGATIAALTHITGREVDVLAGKPSKVMMDVALDRLGAAPEECIMIGDRLETDVKMGKDAGMFAGVVLTGASTRQQAEAAEPKPDFILESIGDLVFKLEKAGLF
jgi:HAD superfamily hydrolase (TIGR01450 family)